LDLLEARRTRVVVVDLLRNGRPVAVAVGPGGLDCHDFPAIHSAVKISAGSPTTKTAGPSVVGPSRPRLKPPGSRSFSVSWMYATTSRFWSGVSWLSPNTGMFCGPESIAAQMTRSLVSLSRGANLPD